MLDYGGWHTCSTIIQFLSWVYTTYIHVYTYLLIPCFSPYVVAHLCRSFGKQWPVHLPQKNILRHQNFSLMSDSLSDNSQITLACSTYTKAFQQDLLVTRHEFNDSIMRRLLSSTSHLKSVSLSQNIIANTKNNNNSCTSSTHWCVRSMLLTMLLLF